MGAPPVDDANYCLRWNDYEKKYAETFRTLREVHHRYTWQDSYRYTSCTDQRCICSGMVGVEVEVHMEGMGMEGDLQDGGEGRHHQQGHDHPRLLLHNRPHQNQMVGKGVEDPYSLEGEEENVQEKVQEVGVGIYPSP